MGFPGGADGKESSCSAGDLGLVPGSGRSPGEGNGNPLQYSCLENPLDRGAWWATARGAVKSRTRLSASHTQCHFACYSSPSWFPIRKMKVMAFTPAWNCCQDKHGFAETSEIQYMSWQLSLEKNSFLEVENSISDAFWLFKNGEQFKARFSTHFSSHIGLLPKAFPQLEELQRPVVPTCFSDARRPPLTWRQLLLHLRERHFPGHPVCPFKFAEMPARCWGLSSTPPFLATLLGNSWAMLALSKCVKWNIESIRSVNVYYQSPADLTRFDSVSRVRILHHVS